MTPRNPRARLAGLVVLLAGIMTADVSGHHGTSVSYDSEKEVTITGERVSWAVELGSRGTLMRSGWTRKTFAAGGAGIC